MAMDHTPRERGGELKSGGPLLVTGGVLLIADGGFEHHI